MTTSRVSILVCILPTEKKYIPTSQISEMPIHKNNPANHREEPQRYIQYCNHRNIRILFNVPDRPDTINTLHTLKATKQNKTRKSENKCSM
ncbi:hypothetical protein M413DRAFT_84378 [Hebeloma cylindrosporum]|uniref:Uncharacterized protein n=1 Tax=Hebeloma cylindrosporum TaxID=76867 RepID=A0A0C3CX39_HEBCY|nr:hypothetical protein M413DRAFT_84378 [Hebeloma cylindrosporum h7]